MGSIGVLYVLFVVGKVEYFMPMGLKRYDKRFGLFCCCTGNGLHPSAFGGVCTFKKKQVLKTLFLKIWS